MSEERIVFLYVTTSSLEEAQKIGRILLERRLCACVNIYNGVQSMYWWQGKLESSQEAIMIVKTREGLVEEAERAIRDNHSYTCPCIAKIPVEIPFKAFEEWLIRETQG
ncbi:MAG: divalent-cation tolerance protein CutA [Caldimicrobium sp.]|nr:divalent-cation tolerance protein CutA [Caldimicrobium sp.]MCX7874506.1 divalent-cation tolerance protein CutA [Caldimicrobium sp.]MDW8094537.1 divalent-cation tolerance protein CutA [Caldimicrobium sp.]